MELENVIQRKAKRPSKAKSNAPVAYVNRKGHTYYIHEGVTKTGKAKYFASRDPKNALTETPAGFEIAEDVNAVVFVQKIAPAIIPERDVKVVREKVASFKHLIHHRVEAKKNQIIVYAPIGLDTVNDMDKSGMFSAIESLRPYAEKLGGIDAMLDQVAKQMGVTTETLLRADALAAAEKRLKTKENLLQNIQYDAVMRFTLDKMTGSYLCERRYYNGDGGWLELKAGKLAALSSKYLRHIGKDSFFELM